MTNTDIDKLRLLAKGMTARSDLGIKLYAEECQEYGEAILALIAGNERMKSRRDHKEGERAQAMLDMRMQAFNNTADLLVEAVALLRGLNPAYRPEVRAFLARIDAK